MAKKMAKRIVNVWLKRIEAAYNDMIDSSKITRDPSQFILSPPIAKEIVNRFIKHRDLIEDSHAGLHGSDPFKEAGYMAYWIAKLKPIQIFKADPDKGEIFINEFLAITVAIAYFHEKGYEVLYERFPQKLIDDLKYTLRYRTITVRTLPIIFEAFGLSMNPII